jgi:hypothetical protein
MKTADYKTLKNEQKTAKWLKDNGISEAQFKTDDIWLLQAQKSATALLKKQIDLLNDKQQNTLMNFCYMAMNSNTRKNITKRMSYEVLNISKQLKRREFIATKKIKTARRKIQAKRQANTQAHI